MSVERCGCPRKKYLRVGVRNHPRQSHSSQHDDQESLQQGTGEQVETIRDVCCMARNEVNKRGKTSASCWSTEGTSVTLLVLCGHRMDPLRCADDKSKSYPGVVFKTPVHPSIRPSIHPSIHPSVHPSICPSIHPSADRWPPRSLHSPQASNSRLHRQHKAPSPHPSLLRPPARPRHRICPSMPGTRLHRIASDSGHSRPDLRPSS